MLQIALDAELLASYFVLGLLLPLLLFLALLSLLWNLQSRLVLFTYYRVVLPELRKNPLLYWLLGGVAVASHELLGHALVGAATGSSTELHTSVTPERGEVRIAHRRSAWGYLSAVLATLAPCFAPPLLALGAFVFLFPNSAFLYAYDFQAAFATILPNLLLLANTLFNSDLTQPANLAFLYLLSVLSLTAGASKTDFKIVLESTKRFWYFALFLIIVFACALEVIRYALGFSDVGLLLYPFASLLLLASLTVLLGLVFPLLLALFIRRMKGFGILRSLLSFIAFPAAYLALSYISLRLPYANLIILIISLVFAFGVEFLLGLVPIRQQAVSRMKRR